MTFGERLRELREKAGLTQERLARAANTSIGNVRNYEQGAREPRWQTVYQLAAALGVTSEAFAVCVKEPAEAEAPPAKKKRKGS